LVAEKAQGLDGWVERLVNARLGYFERRREMLARLFASLRTPGQQIEAQRLTLAHAGQRLAAAMAALQKDKVQGLALARLDGTRLGQLLARSRERLEGLGFLLESLSYERVLGRGFALVRDAAGHAVTSAAGVAPGAPLEIEFRDGRLRATADGGPEPAPTRKRLEPKKSQGSLF